MPLFGNLSAMPLSDLLQWLGVSRKTGILHIERNRVTKQIFFKDGRIVACTTEDPSELLGHFLVSRGRITEEVLSHALSRQEVTRQHLGAILVEMGAISREELTRHLEAKAEEAIFNLFDWEEAQFRFHENQGLDSDVFPVSLRVEDVLLRAAQRLDEMKQIREVFGAPGVILRRTERLPPPEVFRNRMARRICDMIDGRRTVADILLQAHGSEYLVTKFLYELHHNGFVEIVGTRTVREGPWEPAPRPEAVAHPPSPSGASRPQAVSRGGPRPTAAAVQEPVTVARRPPGPVGAIEQARAQLTRGEFEEALDLLNAAHAADPTNGPLRRMIEEAEAAFVDRAYRHYLPPTKVPVLVRSAETLTGEALSPAEYFLLSRIDGVWDIKSIIQITPLREVDVLRTMKRMREKGLLDLRDPS